MAIDLRKEWEQLVKPHLWLKKSQATRKCPWLAIICNTSLFLVNLSTKPLFPPFSLSWWIVFQKEGENDVLMMKGSYNSVKPYFSGVVNDTPKTTKGLCWRGGRSSNGIIQTAVQWSAMPEYPYSGVATGSAVPDSSIQKRRYNQIHNHYMNCVYLISVYNNRVSVATGIKFKLR